MAESALVLSVFGCGWHPLSSCLLHRENGIALIGMAEVEAKTSSPKAHAGQLGKIRSAVAMVVQAKSRVWNATLTMDSPIDTVDFNAYIVPLMPFKLVSRVHDDGHAGFLEEFGCDKEATLIPEDFRFRMSSNYRWQDLRKVVVHFVEALQIALRAIEQASSQAPYGKIKIPRYDEEKNAQEGFAVEVAMKLLGEFVDAALVSVKISFGLVKNEGSLK